MSEQSGTLADDPFSGRHPTSHERMTRPESLGRMFGTVLDCGLFHTFDGDERRRYVASLASVRGAHFENRKAQFRHTQV